MPATSAERFVLDPALRKECEDAIRAGSKSFLAASMLLPANTRTATRALYSFCRASDDLIDESSEAAQGLEQLRGRLDGIYAGRPDDNSCDKAFAAVATHFDIPRTLPEALIEGFAWDAENRRYETFDDVAGYAARVASSVGVMMCLIMGSNDRHVLARAADLGLAMQLTNIARDVGEDARNGRLYLPLEWLDEAQIDPRDFLAAPRATPQIRATVERLLNNAYELYARAMTGIAGLPFGCRVAIRSAALIYREIGREIERAGFDSVGYRAHTTKMRKLELIAYAASTPSLLQPVSITPAHPSTQPMVDAAVSALPVVQHSLDAKAGRMIELMAQSRMRRRELHSAV
jgi:15-cis-phytoene synthase